MTAKTDIIVPVYNNLQYTEKFISSLAYQTEFRLIIIDNGSQETVKKYLNSIEATVITNKENKGYTYAINQGLKISSADTILLANNDTILTPGLIEKLRKRIKTFDIVSPLSNNISKKPNPLLIDFKYTNLEELIKFSNEIESKNFDKTKEVEYVYGHCMMIRKDVLNKAGLLDKRFKSGNYSDTDYCKRARINRFRIGLALDSFVYHFCHSTFKNLGVDIEKELKNEKKVFEKKWQECL
jgi:GT2 family glycosyltransferase